MILLFEFGCVSDAVPLTRGGGVIIPVNEGVSVQNDVLSFVPLKLIFRC